MISLMKSDLCQSLGRAAFHLSLVTLYLYTSHSLGQRMAEHRGQVLTPEKVEKLIANRNLALNHTHTHTDTNAHRHRRHADDDFGGSWRFLTTWNYTLQILFFSMSVVLDLFNVVLHILARFKGGSEFRPKSLSCGMLDLIFHAIVTPLGIYVCIVFWTVYLYDRELIFPAFLDAIIPVWVNHVMHTVIVVAAMLETLIVYHHPPGRRVGLAVVVGVNVAYSSWTLYLGAWRSIWVYPFMEIMSWPARVILYSGSIALCLGLYWAGVHLHVRLWAHYRKNYIACCQTDSSDPTQQDEPNGVMKTNANVNPCDMEFSAIQMI